MDQTMINISGKQSIYDLVTTYPEIKEVMAGLGFKDILKPGMIQTVGKVMTIEKGARMKTISLERIREAFASSGFNLEP